MYHYLLLEPMVIGVWSATRAVLAGSSASTAAPSSPPFPVAAGSGGTEHHYTGSNASTVTAHPFAAAAVSSLPLPATAGYGAYTAAPLRRRRRGSICR